MDEIENLKERAKIKGTELEYEIQDETSLVRKNLDFNDQ